MIDLEEHTNEQIQFRTEMLEKLKHIYHSTHKEIRKHQLMLEYYMKQKEQ